MSDGIVIIGSGFAARQLVKNIRKQDAEIPLTLIAADSMDEYNKPDLSHVISRGQHADDLTLQSAGEFAEQYHLRLFPHTWVSDIDAENHRVKSLDKQWRYDKLVLATGATPFIPGAGPRADANAEQPARIWRGAEPAPRRQAGADRRRRPDWLRAGDGFLSRR